MKDALYDALLDALIGVAAFVVLVSFGVHAARWVAGAGGESS